jgi:flagellar motor switch protein FliN/FliY
MINDETGQDPQQYESFEIPPELPVDVSYGDEPVAIPEPPAPVAQPVPAPAPAIAPVPGLDIVRDIPLTVNVELGRARKEISEILDFGFGTVIVLDKLAGDPVEVFANGKLIARGEVVVIDDSYGVRITEIVQS